ncbi:hypothetical protein B9Z55_013188 [Caenorhabditis nigoni]|uniref:Uncharacterized protein n=1 Tax=Caenorhabditis nigoni TaxID=1611254 RepID=A0A2G5U0J6_9PELO|nr:hypothetical protein B9Z55_013188 [Caenorhabditis nigoni]
MTSKNRNFEQYYHPAKNNHSPEDKENQRIILNPLGARHEDTNYLNSSNTATQNPMTSQSDNLQYPSTWYAPEMTHGYLMNYNCYSGYYSNYQMPYQSNYHF